MPVEIELSREEQLAALTPEIVQSYAQGSLAWSQIRERYGVLDFGLLLRRVGEEGLRLPRAPAGRPSKAREWLREALAEAATESDGAAAGK